MAKICAFPESLEKKASRVGAFVRRESDGKKSLITVKERALIGQFFDDDEATEYLNKIIDKGMIELDGHLPIVINGESGSIFNVRFGDQMPMTKVRELITKFQVGVGAITTPAKQYMQALERLGKVGKPFTEIFEPTQKAMYDTDRRMGYDVIEGLGGRTFQQAIHELEGRVSVLPKNQQELVTLYAEAYTKEELAQPGVLLKEGISQENIAVADRLSALGVAEGIPTLLRTNMVIDQFLRNKKVRMQRIKKLEIDVLEGRLPVELGPQIQRMKQIAGTAETREDVIREMFLSENEVKALEELNILSKNPEAFNIAAIYRYASAPKLEKGFKNGREQLFAQRKMSVAAKAVAEERLKILREAFKDSGYSADQLIGAQLPVFRQFLDAGFAMSKKYQEVLTGLPEGLDVLTRRVLSGHLNPYEMHPSVSLYKHVRNMVLRDTFDPLLPGIHEKIKNAAALDARTGRILADYMNELEGKPNASFRALTAVIKTTGRFAGVKIDDRLAERVVATLNKLTAQATIPFRPALIARNYLQTAFFTMPVVGPSAWKHGLEIASSKETMKYAMDEAIKHGALDPNVIPLFGSTEIFGVDVARVSNLAKGEFAQDLARVGFKLDEAFNWGFSVYRKADDWGRTVAFHAGRKRVTDAIAKYRKHGDIEKLIVDAKVRTFDETVEARFRSLITTDYDGAANYIGKQIADKAHMLYGHANHPAGWGSVPGRLFGQFGTFPVQYLNYMMEGLTRGDWKDRLEFGATHSALNMAVVAGGAMAFGVDLQSWATFPSLRYSGGPYAELTLSVAQAWSGSDAEKSLAMRNLYMMMPTLSSPESIFVPGSYFVADLAEATGAMMEGDPFEGLGLGTGLRFLKPGEETWAEKAISWMVDF